MARKGGIEPGGDVPHHTKVDSAGEPPCFVDTSSGVDMPKASGALERFVEDIHCRFGLRLEDLPLLAKAMEHPSLTCTIKPRPLSVFERLEFLGDRVINLSVAAYLILTYPKEHEGELARRHSYLVRTTTLAGIALSLNLPGILITQKNVVDAAGNMPQSVLADVVEVLYGYIFQTKGYETAASFVLQTLEPYRQQLREAPLESFKDHKSRLQELYLKRFGRLPLYTSFKIGGADHAPIFKTTITLPDGTTLEAQGSSKRVAEQTAAALAIDALLPRR